MFIRTKVITLVASCCIAIPAVGASSCLSSRTRAVAEQTAQVQSVSGHITSVAGNTFTLQPAASRGSNEPGDRKAITFTIDQDTVVEGKIEVGSKADVTDRRQDGNNIAVSIRISSQS